MTTNLAVEQALSRNVCVETENSAGSGIIVQTGLILTAFHLLEVDSDIKVDGEFAEIVLVDPKNDIMVLKVKTHLMEPVTLANGVQLLEPVIAIGNPLDLIHVVSVGRVVKVDVENDFIYTDNLVIAGFSGGGVYNMRGSLVGVIVAMKGRNTGSAMMMIVPIKRAMGLMEVK